MSYLRLFAFALLVIQLLQFGVAQSAVDDPATVAINIGADYILRTDLFKALAQVDLPAEISLPGFIKIVNLRVAGLDNVSRSCSLQLQPIGAGSQIEAKTCVYIRSLRGNFVVQVLGQPVVQIAVRIAEFRARLTLNANMVPGGSLGLDAFDAWLSPIEVTNQGIVGGLVSKALQIDAVREQIRLTVAQQLGKKINEALKEITLPN